MNKSFNTAGPCLPDEHYMLPAQERCQGLMELIDRKQYFVIHAARQTGKTTLIKEVVGQLESAGDYYALYCSLESVQAINEPEVGIPAIMGVLARRIRFHPELRRFPFAEEKTSGLFNTLLNDALSWFCEKLDKPLVIFFDEIDCLSNGTLIAFLRQLRDGYVSRPDPLFVHSIALVGMRNIRDYKCSIRDDQETLGSASPFNIVSDTFTLRNFTREEILRLYAMHTGRTGQSFPQDSADAVEYYTQGQPWLVNAIAREIVEKILKGDYSKKISGDLVERAVETIIRRRDTHIDSLMERLKEKRVQKIVEPLILGENREYGPLDDDYAYVIDLGLTVEKDRKLLPANPIYSEVMIRALTSQTQTKMDDLDYPPDAPAWLVNGRLDMSGLLKDFQQFWRENSEIWMEKYQYKEAAPHLILHAFLRRVVNSGGSITREMATGRRRLDLCVIYEDVRYPVELKLRYDESVYGEGMTQLLSYMDKLGCTEGWLAVFDRRESVSWDEKIFWRTEEAKEKIIHIIGC